MIESRMGGLPDPVSDVVDTLAVGEPIDLAALQRITDPAAIEEADTRGLITFDSLAGGVQVRLAHPLLGQIRRKRAPMTKLRRLRGLVAAELAGSEDIRMVVRRATLTLESDHEPDADLLVRAAHGAVWLADLPLADRLADAAIRAGAGPEPNFVRAHALSWLGRGEEAESVLAAVSTEGLSDIERARLAFLRASNLLWAIGDPARAKAVIDDAAHVAPAGDRTYIDAFLTVYWFATDRPDLALRHMDAGERRRQRLAERRTVEAGDRQQAGHPGEEAVEVAFGAVLLFVAMLDGLKEECVAALFRD